MTAPRDGEAKKRAHSAAAEPPEPLEDADYRRQAEFRYAIRRFSRFSEDQARLAGLTPQQHFLLLAVRGHQDYPRVSVKEIAEQLQIRHHSASLLIERGVARGLLAKGTDPSDRRKVLVSLTPQGEQLLTTITRANRRELHSLDAALFGLRDRLEEVFSAQAHLVANTPAGPAADPPPTAQGDGRPAATRRSE